MKLNAPTQIVWIIALVVGLLGIIASLVTIPVLSGIALWLVVVAWLLLIVSTVLKGA